MSQFHTSLMNQPIVIKTDADLTPKGKRRVRVVSTRGGYGSHKAIRWYVGGRYYRQLPVTVENMRLSEQWYAAQ